MRRRGRCGWSQGRTRGCEHGGGHRLGRGGGSERRRPWSKVVGMDGNEKEERKFLFLFLKNKFGLEWIRAVEGNFFYNPLDFPILHVPLYP